MAIGFNENYSPVEVPTSEEFDSYSGDSGWKRITVEAGFKHYGAGTNPLEYRKIGKLVQIRGAVENTRSFTSSVNSVLVAHLPSEVIPRKQASGMGQGSNANRFYCLVDTDGTLNISRYTSSGSLGDNIAPGAWMRIDMMYFVE